MATVSSFRDVVALWRTPAAMAADIGASISAARKWPQRDSIPDDWWAPIAESDVGRSAGVTIEILAALAARRTTEGRVVMAGVQP